MKILILSSMYPNSKLYLSGVFVHEQVKALKRIGMEVTVIAPVPFVFGLLKRINSKWDLYSKVPEYEEIDSIKILHSRYLAVPGGYLRHYWAYSYVRSATKLLKKYFYDEKFDLIHAHGSLPDDYAAKILAQQLNIPFIITVHGATVGSLFKRKAQFAKSKAALLKANAVIAVSSKVEKRIKELVGRNDNIYIIHNGFKPIENNETLHVHDGINILFGGNLIEQKGCEYLIKAFDELRKKYSDISLTIAGGGTEKKTLEQLVETLELTNKVFFKGFVKHDKMLKLMMECDIFILPSWNEALGIVYIEAMSLKKPTIGTFGEGIEDIISDGENGLLVEPKNVDSIVEKISILIENENLRKELGLKGYESVKELTWENNAKKTMQLYKKVLSK